MGILLAFAGSNSTTSINLKLVRHTASLIKAHSVQTLDMSRYPFPMYSIDAEKENGFSNSLIELRDDLKKADGLIISVNEHNGAPSAYFKNLFDWFSRLEREFLDGKKVFLMATSPGKRGAISALEEAEKLLPRFGATVVTTFSLPSFGTTFDERKGILDNDKSTEHLGKLEDFIGNL